MILADLFRRFFEVGEFWHLEQRYTLLSVSPNFGQLFFSKKALGFESTRLNSANLYLFTNEWRQVDL